jgi:hypothetical protein
MSEQCLIADYYGSAIFLFTKIMNNYEKFSLHPLKGVHIHNFHACGFNCVALAALDASNSLSIRISPQKL